MDSVYPCKLNEYLAMGKHVVSTNIKEVINYSKEYPEVITITNEKNDFISQIKNFFKN